MRTVITMTTVSTITRRRRRRRRRIGKWARRQYKGDEDDSGYTDKNKGADANSSKDYGKS